MLPSGPNFFSFAYISLSCFSLFHLQMSSQSSNDDLLWKDDDDGVLPLPACCLQDPDDSDLKTLWQSPFYQKLLIKDKDGKVKQHWHCHHCLLLFFHDYFQRCSALFPLILIHLVRWTAFYKILSYLFLRWLLRPLLQLRHLTRAQCRKIQYPTSHPQWIGGKISTVPKFGLIHSAWFSFLLRNR